MPAERLAGGSPVLTTGLYGGYLERVPTGIPPIERGNPADPADRQRFFYGAVSELASGNWTFADYWAKGGPMSIIESEFSFALGEAVRLGVMTRAERGKLEVAYKERTTAFSTMTGLADVVRKSDGGFATMLNYMPREEVMEDYGLTEKRSAMISHDPAIAWPLMWIKQCGQSGSLLYHYWLVKEGRNPAGIEIFKQSLVDQMRASVGANGWGEYRQRYGIPEGIEDKLVSIALDFWSLEILPEVHREIVKRSERGLTKLNLLSYPRDIGGGRTIASVCEPMKPDLGLMPWDDVYWSNLDQPAGILWGKHAYREGSGTLMEAPILRGVHDFFTYGDKLFPGDDGAPDRKPIGMAGRIPSEITYKDMKRYAAVWDNLIGGSQGVKLADFKDFPDGLNALCNLYNGVSGMEDVVGWMVGKILDIKTQALLATGDNSRILEQIFRVMRLGDQDTPEEIRQAAGGVLGSGGASTFGAIAIAVGKYGLNIGTPEYHHAISSLKTGIRNSQASKAGQYLLASLAVANRIFPSGGGGKKRK